MTYAEACDFLFHRLPMFQREGAVAYKPDLRATEHLLACAGSPHLSPDGREMPVVHVAGTNGKGSVCHLVAAALTASGRRTGLFTSPHLVDFRERIRVDGKPIPESAVVEFVETYLPCADSGPRPPSFFEWTFAMAVWWFRRSAVELAVLETGMGGRLDSTNVFRAPWATAITNVGLDHQQFLGPDIRSIAAEKAGILKDCRPVVVGRMRPEALSVVLGQALRTSSEVYYADSAHEPALPNEAPYAAENRATARKLLDVLASLPEWDSTRPCALLSAPDLTASGHYGRWQWLAPAPSGARILADCAHNVDGLNALFGSLPAHCTLHVVYGTVADKSLAEVFPLLPRTARWYFCAADIPRALPPSDLAHIAGEQGLTGSAYGSVREALAAAATAAESGDLVVVTGSIFVVAEVI
jgi:dihydrofolate synthase/folylpolyglutamate synthase